MTQFPPKVEKWLNFIIQKSVRLVLIEPK